MSRFYRRNLGTVVWSVYQERFNCGSDVMSTTHRITAEEYDSMIAKGAFDGINRKIELVHGELREMKPAGPVHEDYID